MTEFLWSSFYWRIQSSIRHFRNTTSVADQMGHGTEVAGQISANENILGVDPGVTINIYRAFGQLKLQLMMEIKFINLSSGQYLMISGNMQMEPTIITTI
ncbi:MAG: S8 family serine peptidase [Streptococcaceae bacterium]|nr:S8 family serine peptidase [Streptococcaceae bacterium]